MAKKKYLAYSSEMAIATIYTHRGKWKTLKRKPKYGNGSTETEIRK